MPPISKYSLAAASGSLMALGLSVAANTEHGLLTGLVAIGGGIGTNLLSDVAKSVYHQFGKKYLQPHPNEVNHDLHKTIQKALHQGLDNLFVLYKENHPDSDSLKKVMTFIRGIKDTDLVIPSDDPGYNLQIKEYLYDAPDATTGRIIYRLGLDLEKLDLPASFLSFFQENITAQVRLCFAEALKDKDNHPAWVAFQKMMLEDIEGGIEAILQSQQRLETDLASLKAQGPPGTKEPSRSPKPAELRKILQELKRPANLEIQLNKALDNYLADIRQELKAIKSISLETRNEVKHLRYDLHTQRIDWVSGKMVLTYAIIGCLVIAIFANHYYWLQQPFSVTVAVHGPKGLNDLVLQNKGQILVTYGDKQEKAPINGDGQAYFKQIPGKYRNQPITAKVVDIDAEPYRQICDTCTLLLQPGALLDIPLRTNKLDKIRGIVLDEKGNPLAGARILVQDLETRSDLSGMFIIDIPANKQQRLQSITVIKPGYQTELYNNIPVHTQDKPMAIILKKIN